MKLENGRLEQLQNFSSNSPLTEQFIGRYYISFHRNDSLLRFKVT